MNREIVEVPELARRWEVAENTIYKAVKAGTMPIQPIRVGRRIIFSRRAVDALLGGEPVATGPAIEPEGD